MDRDSKLVAFLSSPIIPPNFDAEFAYTLLETMAWDVNKALAHVSTEMKQEHQHIHNQRCPAPTEQITARHTSGRAAGHLPSTTLCYSAPTPPPANVGPLESLGSLALEFKHNDEFKKKIGSLLRGGYHSWRRIRGDGNCFYRAVGFGLFEWFASEESRTSRCSVAEVVYEQFAGLEFVEPEHIEAHKKLLVEIHRVVQGSSADGQEAQKSLLSDFLDPNGWLDLSLIRALRYATAKFLLKHVDNEEIGNGIAPGIVVVADGFESMDSFCQQIVLPEGIEAEAIIQRVIPFVLGIRLRILYLDRVASSGGEVVPSVDYDGGDGPRIFVQLRPGHYDLIYFEAVDSSPPLQPPRRSHDLSASLLSNEEATSIVQPGASIAEDTSSAQKAGLLNDDVKRTVHRAGSLSPPRRSAKEHDNL